MFMRSSQFDKLLDKATSNLILEEDWQSIMKICDMIRQGDCPPKQALNSIKKKVQNQNPHTSKFALLVLESVVKNCGPVVHCEIATVDFMDWMRDMVRQSKTEMVSSKILELLQTWASAFRSNPNYSIVQSMILHSLASCLCTPPNQPLNLFPKPITTEQKNSNLIDLLQDTVTQMKAEGYKLPVIKESDAMFSADIAPKWVESTSCHRCRVLFTLVLRKHHCRACGNVFCSKCSTKTSTLPRFGIEKQVRVCEACYELNNKPTSSLPNVKHEVDTLPVEYLNSSLAQQTQVPKPKTEEDLKEEEEMQLAMALSKSEAEAREKEKKRVTSEMMSNTTVKSQPPVVEDDDEEEEDPELARYLNRSYWEKKQAEENVASTEKKILSPDHFRVSPGGPPSAPATPTTQLENGEASETELKNFVLFLKSQVEIFVNRMKSNSSRGRSISNDSSVQNLFMRVTKNHSTLLSYIHQQDDSRVYYEGLQDKLAQVKDAMMALDALREEHREKLRREAEEAERSRQLQMAQKLEIMRRRKQEYLQFQRQLAIQKVQEQEREMQLRQEQQRQQYLMGNMVMPQHPQQVPWDPSIPMQAPPSQYGQQYQSLPGGYLASGGYPMPGPSGGVTQPPSTMPMPGNVVQTLPHSGQVPLQRHDQQPPGGPPQSLPQPVQSRVMGPQQNPGRPIPNSSQLPQMHPSQIPSSNYQGMPLPSDNQILTESRSLVMAPPGGSSGLPPQGATSNMGLPLPQVVDMKPRLLQMVRMPSIPGQSVGIPPGVVLSQQAIPLPQGSQQGLPPGMGMPPRGEGMKHMSNGPVNGQPNMVIRPLGPQGVPPMQQPQSQPQIPPSQQEPNEQNYSKTGELIRFD